LYSCLLLGVLVIVLQFDDFFTHDLDLKYYRNMNDFKTILIKLKEIIAQQLQTDKKVLDKDVAQALSVKSTTLASYKSRNKPPYKAILTYCHNNKLDVRKVLFNDTELILKHTTQVPVVDGRVRVKYFRTLEAYANYLKKYPISSSKILEIL